MLVAVRYAIDAVEGGDENYGSTLGRRHRSVSDYELSEILTCKARAIYVLYPMVRDQELFLPPHEDCTTISVTHR